MSISKPVGLVEKHLVQQNKKAAISLPMGILIVNLAASSYNVGTVWMAQLNYNLWAYVGVNEFGVYKDEWWSRIQPVIFPLAGVSTICSLAMLRWRPAGVPAWALWLGVALQAGWIGGTLVWWAPLMVRMKQVSGDYKSDYDQLLTTHWIRVSIITAYAILVFATLVMYLRSNNPTRLSDNSEKAV